MNQKTILLPLCAQALLSIGVLFWLFFGRLTAIKKSRVRIQKLAHAPTADEVFKNSENISDNFENLFELPVLFFAAGLLIFVTQTADDLYLNLSWAFVFFRALHSLIHGTTNNVRQRFGAYLISTLLLLSIWIRILFQLMRP